VTDNAPVYEPGDVVYGADPFKGDDPVVESSVAALIRELP